MEQTFHILHLLPEILKPQTKVLVVISTAKFCRIQLKCLHDNCKVAHLLRELVTLCQSQFVEIVENLQREYKELLVYGADAKDSGDSTVKINRFLHKLMNSSQSIGLV